MDYKNLEINIKFGKGVILEEKNPFDGVLAYLYAKELQQKGEYESFENKLIDLPFVKKTKGIYHTSYPIIEEEVYIEFAGLTQKFDTNLYDELGENKKKTIDFKRGSFKMSNFDYESLLIKNIKFYVCGDIDIIEELLQNFTHYGKKSSNDFGRIQTIKIKVIESDYSLIGENHEVNRFLPSKIFPM